MFAIGQTVLFNKTVKGHVVFATATEISVRTSVTGRTISCKPNELKILSEEALPLEAEAIPQREYQQQVVEPTIIAMAIPKANSIPAAGTKLSRALDIYKVLRATDGFSRKSCITMFMESLEMSEAGASTYYNMCQKAQLN